MSSWLVQRIVVPAGTVDGFGEKTKLSILTCVAGLSSTVAPKLLDLLAIMIATMASAANPNVKAVLFMTADLLFLNLISIPKWNRLRPARACPGHNSRRGSPAGSSIAPLELSLVRVKALPRAWVEGTRWTPPYEMLRCLPPSAWFGVYGS